MMKKALIPIAISLFGLVASLVLVEVMVRVVSYFKKEAPTWTDRPAFYFQAEKSPTLQDYFHSPVKGEQTFRIAVVGDSFSFAPYMQFTDAFPKKLEQMLNLNDTSLKTEVINYGVPAYSTSHEVKKVKDALEQQADLVILQITLNDPEIKAHTPIGITIFNRFGPAQWSPWQELVFTHWKTAGLIAQRIHNSQTHREYKKYFLDLFENPKSWDRFAKSMKEIVMACKEKKVPFVAVVFPLFGLPLDESYPFYSIHQKVDGLLTSLEAPHFDISAAYRGIPLERLQVLPGVDRHPNEIGHRIAAEQIYSWLATNDYIPDALKINKRFKGRTQIIKEEPYLEAK